MSLEENKKPGIFVTQEDIDAALRGASPPEGASGTDDFAPVFLEESDIVATGFDADTDSEDMEYFGLLSKEDIEALLHGDLGGSSGQNVQNEIDSLMQTAASEKAAPADGGRIAKRNTTQDDVERMIREAAEGPGGQAGAAKPPGGETSGKGGAASQDDIDRLLMGAADGDEVTAEIDGASESTEPDTGGAVSQDDIDRLLMGAADSSGEVTAEFDPAPEPAEPEDGEAVSQDDIDRLLMGALNEAETDAEGAASVPDSGDDVSSLISQSDLDKLIGGEAAEGGIEAVSSSDTDAPGGHISQDDINRLLKESLDEAETQPAEEAPDDVDESDFQEPVILAADESPTEAAPPVAKVLPLRMPRIAAVIGDRKHRLILAVAAGIVLLVSVSVVMMHSGPAETVRQPRVQTFAISQTYGEARDASVASEKRVHLTGFVLLVPPNASAISYVAADLILDFSDSTIVAVIKENEAFVRDIVYGTINNELMTRDISAIDEISLELAIRKALGRIVAREAIERIAFERFLLV